MKKELESRFVTRQYMLAQDFELYFYSDSGMAEVRTHSNDYYEFYFFLEGDVCMKIGERSYLLKYGDIILIPPQIPHCAIIQNPHSHTDGSCSGSAIVIQISCKNSQTAMGI